MYLSCQKSERKKKMTGQKKGREGARKEGKRKKKGRQEGRGQEGRKKEKADMI